MSRIAFWFYDALPALPVGGIGKVLVPIALVVAHPIGAAKVVWVVGKAVLPHVFNADTRDMVEMRFVADQKRRAFIRGQ